MVRYTLIRSRLICLELKDKMEYIKRCIDHLDILRKEYGAKQIIHSFLMLTSTLYTLQTAIQALIDMGLRLLAEMGRKPPQQYSDIGKMLKDDGIFTVDDSTLFRKMVGFRNIMVHRYLGVDMKLLEKIINEKLYRDILRLAIKILEAAESKGLDP